MHVQVTQDIPVVTVQYVCTHTRHMRICHVAFLDSYVTLLIFRDVEVNMNEYEDDIEYSPLKTPIYYINS